MATTLKFYLDAGLTTPVVTPINIQQADDGTTGPVDLTLFLGSVVPAKKFQATSNPAIDQITITIDDANPASEQEPDAIKLALTLLGLDSATPGDPLDVGTELLSEVGNALTVFIRVEDQTMVIATSLDLSLVTNLVSETAV